MNFGRYQLVWWGPPLRWRLPVLGSLGPFPGRGEHVGCIYRWRVLLGWLEIRRWGEAIGEGDDA